MEFEFQMAPNSEAPAEMHFFVPRYKLLNLAENCTHNFHNLLPFRGAEVRDALAWSKYLGEALQMWGGKADAMCGQHHWPVWGQERIDTMIRQQRDLYKFAHDQTIRLMNHGLTATEIAEAIKLPASLDGAWHGRGYYGHIRHNVKAIYQKYLGWYDANPVNLDPLPPVESGKKYVEYMGGADAILARARERISPRASSASSRRPSAIWCSPILTIRPRARCWPTRSSSSATPRKARPGATPICSARRNCATACQRCRRGSPMPRETLAALRTEQLWDVLGVRLNGPKAEGKRIVLNWNFTDTSETLRPQPGEQRADLCRGPSGSRRRCQLYVGARRARRSHRQADDVPGSGRQRQDHGQRQPDAARRADDADGRIPAHVRDRRAEADAGELNATNPQPGKGVTPPFVPTPSRGIS